MHEYMQNSAYFLNNRERLPVGSIVQFLTSHGKFKAYLHRFGLSDEVDCEHCGVAETPKHITHDRGYSWPVSLQDLVKNQDLFTEFCHGACRVLTELGNQALTRIRMYRE